MVMQPECHCHQLVGHIPSHRPPWAHRGPSCETALQFFNHSVRSIYLVDDEIQISVLEPIKLKMQIMCSSFKLTTIRRRGLHSDNKKLSRFKAINIFASVYNDINAVFAMAVTN